MAMVTFSKNQWGRWVKIISIPFIAVAITGPVWEPYLLGYGGHEQLVINLLLCATIVVLVSLGVVVYQGARLLYCLFCHQPFAVRPMLVALVVILLVVLTPLFVAANLRKLGALHRLNQLGGKSAYVELIDASQKLLNGSVSITDNPNTFPGVFKRLGVKHIQIYKEDPRIKAETSGRPFNSGWIIFTNTVESRSGQKGVEVYPGLYRY